MTEAWVRGSLLQQHWYPDCSLGFPLPSLSFLHLPARTQVSGVGWLLFHQGR